MKRITILIISIFSLALCFAQTPNYPIIEKGGNQYYEYTVQPGDGLFAIARKFGIKQNDLHEANTNLSTDIKVGQKILIPINVNTVAPEIIGATTHVVEAKQTLYSISRLYNVPVDTLIALNPNAKNGIRIGETIIISRSQTKSPNLATSEQISTPQASTPVPSDVITHTVEKKETLYSISKKYNIAIHDLIALNPELNDGLKAGSVIKISKGNTQPQNKPTTSAPQQTINKKQQSEQPTAVKPEKAEKHEKNTKAEKVEKPNRHHRHVTTPSAPIDSIVTSTDEPIQTPIVTTNTDTTTILNIVYLLPLIPQNANDEKNLQRFIEFYRGSLLALNEAKSQGFSANIYTYDLPKSGDKINEILRQLDDKQIDIVIGPAYSEQLNPVLTYTKERNITTIVPFSSKIDTTFYYPNLLQFNPPQDYLFENVLKTSFAHRNLRYIIAHFDKCTNKGETFAQNLKRLLKDNRKHFIEMTIKPEFVDSLAQMVSSDTTILVLGSSRINDVAPIIDSLNLYQLPQLHVWGFEDWGTNIIKKYPQTLFYSLFFPHETSQYDETYKTWFGTRKQTVGAQYDLLGYDLTTYALNGIINGTPQPTTQSLYLQSYPKFEFIEGRWLNTKYYLLRWDNISIKEVK